MPLGESLRKARADDVLGQRLGFLPPPGVCGIDFKLRKEPSSSGSRVPGLRHESFVVMGLDETWVDVVLHQLKYLVLYRWSEQEEKLKIFAEWDIESSCSVTCLQNSDVVALILYKMTR